MPSCLAAIQWIVKNGKTYKHILQKYSQQRFAHNTKKKFEQKNLNIDYIQFI